MAPFGLGTEDEDGDDADTARRDDGADNGPEQRLEATVVTRADVAEAVADDPAEHAGRQDAQEREEKRRS